MCTGLEPLLVEGLGMTAGAASTAAAATAIGAAGAGLAASQVLKPKMPTAAVATPMTPPQVTKAADRTTMLATNAAAARPGGAFAGNSSTFLTGASGIDARSLTLGRNTLLGS